MESQIAYAEKTKFFAKLAAAKEDFKKPVYQGSTVADRMVLDKKALKTSVVSKSTMFAYCGENGVCNSLHSGASAYKYAEILARQKMDAAGLKEPTVEIAESSIKRALCFKALQNAAGIKEPTAEEVLKLHAKAAVLSDRFTKESMHVLNDKNLMREAFDSVKVKEDLSLSQSDIARVIDAIRCDNILIAQAQKSQTIEISRSGGMGM
jgi:hypothetical protein